MPFADYSKALLECSRTLLISGPEELKTVNQEQDKGKTVGDGGTVGRWDSDGRWEAVVDGGPVDGDGGRWTVDGGRWTVDGGRWTVDGGRWTVDGGRWTVDGGRWTVTTVGPSDRRTVAPTDHAASAESNQHGH